MALNLTVKEGERVYVEDRPLAVFSVPNPDMALVDLDTGERLELYPDQSVEVYPKVYVSLGKKMQIGVASLSFEAPRNIVILTEKNWQAQTQV